MKPPIGILSSKTSKPCRRYASTQCRFQASGRFGRVVGERTRYAWMVCVRSCDRLVPYSWLGGKTETFLGCGGAFAFLIRVLCAVGLLKLGPLLEPVQQIPIRQRDRLSKRRQYTADGMPRDLPGCHLETPARLPGTSPARFGLRSRGAAS